MRQQKNKINIKDIFSRNYGTKLAVIIIVLLYAGIFFSSLAYSTLDKSNYIDGGWKYALSSFRHHPSQSFGNDVFFTYGPLSTRIVTTVNHLDTSKDFLIGSLIITTLFGLCLYSLISALRSYSYREKYLIGGTTAIASVCILSIAGIDILFYLTLLAIYERASREKKIGKLLLLLAGPALLATYKNSFLITILPILLIVSLNLRYSMGRKLGGAISLLLLPLLFLVAEGVSVPNLAKYLLYTLRNSLSYGDFMNLTDHPAICMTFFSIFISYVVLRLVGIFLDGDLKPKTMISPVVIFIGESWVLYIALKEAITRSDAHLIVFLPFIFYMLARLFISANKYLRLNFIQYSVISLIVFLICVRIFAPMNKRLILNFTRHQYFANVIKQVSLRDMIQHYDYAYFSKERKISQRSFSDIVLQSRVIRQSLQQYINKTGRQNPSIVGYGNSVFFVPAVSPSNYFYSPFIQNYPAQPPQLFDRLYKNFLINHPDYLVFWDKIAPNIDSKLPSQDLPETDRYLQTKYEVVASDRDHGMFVLAKKQSTQEAPNRCETKTSVSQLGQDIAVSQDARNLRIYMEPRIHLKIKDAIYKKPIYEMYLYNNSGEQRQFRIVPATLEDDFYVNPWLPFIADNRPEDRFQISKINIVSSDQRTPPIKVSVTSCEN